MHNGIDLVRKINQVIDYEQVNTSQNKIKFSY
jgi:hypothetical protein